MVTRNFLNILAMALQAGSDLGGVPGRAVNGEFRYFNGALSFLNSPTKAGTKDATAAGISVGTGNTAPTEDDWQLEEHLGTGINITLTETVYGNDAPGVPYVQYKVTVTNTGSAPITVKEIGYKQTVGSARYPGSSVDGGTRVFLLDRTVLDTPVTIAAGDAGIITYKLRTIPRLYDTVAGVQMVSFSDGTDEQIAAVLDAAIAGDIDLQQDAGWRVGDKRKISLAAFTGGNNVTNNAEDVFIAISSFEEYMGCGNILQFDFACCTTKTFRMNSSNTTAGGYGATEMYTTTLPALAEALPSWLKSRLKTFSVLASAGGSDLTTIETVTGNKLALRSAVEVFGAGGNGQPGEGTQVEYYNTPAEGRIKRAGISVSAASWWERSAGSATYFCCVNTNGSANHINASTANGLAPFGCI